MIYSDLIKNSAKLLSANVLAQVIGLAIYPVLTRIYSVEDFGLLNIFMVIGGIASVVATAEYQNAVLLPESESDAVSCVHVGVLTSLVMSLIFVIATPFADVIERVGNMPGLAGCFWLLPIYIFVSAVWNMLNMWHTRLKQFGAISVYQVSKCSSSALLKWLFSFVSRSGLSLVVASVVAPLVSLVGDVSLRYGASFRPLLSFDVRRVLSQARRYVNFPKFALPRSAVGYFNNNMFALVMTPFFGLQTMGYCSMVFTLAYMPVSMISSSLCQVLFKDFSDRLSRGLALLPFVRRFVFLSLLVIVPFFGILAFVLPALCEWLLGDGWGTTGVFIRLMLPHLALCFVNASLSFLPDLFQRQKKSMLVEIMSVVMRAAGLFVGVLADDVHIAIVSFCIGGILVLLYQLHWFFSLVSESDAHE